MNNNTKNRKRNEKGQYQTRKSKLAKVARSGCKDGMSIAEQKLIFYGV